MGKIFSPKTYAGRLSRVREEMKMKDIDLMLIPVSGDMAWLMGYEGSIFDACSLLIIGRDEFKPLLLMSGVEFGGVRQIPEVFDCQVFTDDGVINDVLGPDELRDEFAGLIAVGDDMKAHRLLGIQRWYPKAKFIEASDVISPIRSIKDDEEVVALRKAAIAVDRVIRELQRGRVRLRGRTEKAVAEDIEKLLIQHGHDQVDFIIVASGPNAANPHHRPDETIIDDGILLFDIGGKKDGYSSDTTRCVHMGRPSREFVDVYNLVRKAKRAAIASVRPGVSVEDIDSAARTIIEQAGFGEEFFHATGHGIGRDTHEKPHIRRGDTITVQENQVFSIEPGIYIDGQWGIRIEDIVVVTSDGCKRLNRTTERLVIMP